MRAGDPLIINLACTGVIATRAMSPHIPFSHDEIVEDVARCLEQGVQMVHLHARDAAGVQTGDAAPYGRLIEAIRQLPGGREAVLCVEQNPQIPDRTEYLLGEGTDPTIALYSNCKKLEAADADLIANKTRCQQNALASTP